MPETWRRLRLIFTVGLLAASPAYGQNASHPRFEVASVKPGTNVFSTKPPERLPGRIRWTTQLNYLIGYAYSLDFSRVSGPLPGTVYALEATFDPHATDNQVRLMLQSLLIDRFKMRSHLVTVERNGYALCIGKGGIRIKESQPAADRANVPGSHHNESFVSAVLPEARVIAITGRRASISQLAETLQRSLGVPVSDGTGLAGIYDFAFRFSEDLSAEHQTDAPSLATALKENLGLTMKKQKGALETLIVDHIEELSPN
jgi:uncharacterized protein (TIGR03435 family)